MYKSPVQKTNFDDVGDFHEKYNLPNTTHHAPEPLAVDSEMVTFRIKFMLEEILEFCEAVGVRVLWDKENRVAVEWIPGQVYDPAKAFDALLDEVYVVMGTAHLFGFPWQEGWDRVQTANMSKIRALADGSDSKRGSSFDVVKPEGWIAPDIAGLLAECGWDICPERHPKTGEPCIVKGDHVDHQAMGTERMQIFGSHLQEGI